LKRLIDFKQTARGPVTITTGGMTIPTTDAGKPAAGRVVLPATDAGFTLVGLVKFPATDAGKVPAGRVENTTSHTGTNSGNGVDGSSHQAAVTGIVVLKTHHQIVGTGFNANRATR